MVDVHGCVPALAIVRTAARLISRIWLGAAPEMHAPYCCCGRTPVWYSFVARWFVLTSVCTHLDLIAPLRSRLTRKLIALLVPQPELTPRSSAEVTAVIACPARESARAARPAESLLLALMTDLTDTVSPLCTKPVDMLSPDRQ